MTDEPSTKEGAEDPAPRADDATAELPVVTPEPARQEEFPIDEAMLAAFLGEVAPPAAEAAVVAEDVAVGAEDEVVAEDEAVGAEDEVVAKDEPEPVMADEPEVQPAVAAAGAGAHAAPRRRGRSALTVIGIILIILAVGAAGVLVGRLTAPDPGVVIQKETVVEEDVAAAPMAVGPLPVPAPGTVVITTARVPSAIWPVVLTGGESLSDSAGTAPGYRLVNSGISGAQVAGVLATTFGAPGSVQETSSGWQVGADGEPTVTVVNDPLFSWTYADDAALAIPVAGDPMEPAIALGEATEVLQGIGVDISTVEFEIEIVDGRSAVNAWRVIEGQRTQLGWRLVFDTDGTVLQASGFSSGLEAVPDYPIVGAASAVARSQQSPWSALPASPITGPIDSTEAAAPPSAAAGAPRVDLPITTVAVTGAEIGLAQYWQPDGSVLLLPSWILTAADGSTWSLLAVAEPAVTFVDQPFPIDVGAPGFVAGALPSSSDEVVVDEDVVSDEQLTDDELLPGEAGEGAPLVDEGTVEDSGDVVFDPSADPAAEQ